jgi:CO dehydrogenase/acetyl-CoA synthase alpha subunit
MGEGEVKLQIQPETIEQKTISEHMEKEFGMGVKSYKYSNIKNWRRWDIFLSLLFFAFLIPIQDTFRELN